MLVNMIVMPQIRRMDETETLQPDASYLLGFGFFNVFLRILELGALEDRFSSASLAARISFSSFSSSKISKPSSSHCLLFDGIHNSNDTNFFRSFSLSSSFHNPKPTISMVSSSFSASVKGYKRS